MSDERTEVVILETADSTELALARNLIQEEGIPCRVRSGSASAILGAVFGPQVGGVYELLVPAELEQRALDVIEAAWRSRPRGADEEQTG